MNETWRPVSGYEGLYAISSTGRVFSIRNDKMLKPSENEKGYLRVCLQRDGDKKWSRIHRLVAQAFIPNPDGKETVDHINGVRNDNRLENLRWATMTEQNEDEERLKRMSRSMRAAPSVTKKKRSVVQCDMLGTIIATHTGMNDAARAVGSTVGNIYSCCNGKRKSCKGYTFRYADKEALSNGQNNPEPHR